MTEEQFRVIWLSLLVLGLFWMSFGYRLSYIKHRRNRKPTMQEREGFAGKHLKDYKPRRNIHSVINNLFTKPRTIAASVIGLLDEFPDLSFYQGGIDWAKMRTKASKVIIRAGQRNWVDIKFIVNYAAAKLAGFLRGVYWFYDGNASPGEQAKILTDLLKLYGKPELGIWIDWERNSGGAWEGLKNVVAMMQEVERQLPGVEVGLYTGYYFFIENSNRFAHASQYAYLAKRKLWLAFYAELSKVLIPSLWPHMTYWQKGTPSRGAEYGVESKEIDMNEDMDGGEVPTPIPPEEEDMTITYTGKVKDASAQNANVRVDADTIASVVGTLAPGTAFTAEGQKVFNDGYDWLNIATPTHGWLAVTSNIEYQPVTPPAPVTPFPFRVTGTSLTLHAVDEAGVKWQATIAVEMAVEFVRE